MNEVNLNPWMPVEDRSIERAGIRIPDPYREVGTVLDEIYAKDGCKIYVLRQESENMTPMSGDSFWIFIINIRWKN